MTDWEVQLELYDEPHGAEFFLVDHSTSPPTWYNLDGTLSSSAGEASPRSAEAIRSVASRRGWTVDKLYRQNPVRHTN